MADAKDFHGEYMYKVKDVARILNFSKATVYSWCNNGWVTVVPTPGGGIRIPASELKRIMETGITPPDPTD